MKNAKDEMQKSDGFEEKLIKVGRNTTVTRGGRTFGFSALVVVGNYNGTFGIGRGKAKEVPAAIQKAMEAARRSLVTIDLKNGTLHHKIKARHGASQIVMLPAQKGTGVIAGGAMRLVLEMAGVKDVLAKSIGSTNPVNAARATLNGLLSMTNPKKVAAKRGISVDEVLRDINE